MQLADAPTTDRAVGPAPARAPALWSLVDALAVVAGLALLAVAATVSLDVLARWLLRVGLPARSYLETYAIAAALVLGFPPVLLARKAIDVEVVDGWLRAQHPRMAAAAAALVTAGVAVFFGLAAWQLGLYALKLRASQEVVMGTELPVWPFWCFIAAVLGLSAAMAVVGAVARGPRDADGAGGSL